jgi:uncharacterized protein (TIGR00369 family)
MIELPRYETCFVCGDPARNPHSLELRLYLDPESGLVSAAFTPREGHEGYPDVVHGGILTSLLDEVSLWAASYAARSFCVTRELRTKFLQAAPLGAPLRVYARVTEHRRKLITAAGTIENVAGEAVARSVGRFFPAYPDEWAKRVRLPDSQTSGPGGRSSA